MSNGKKRWAGITAVALVIALVAAYIPLEQISRATLARRQAGQAGGAAANYLVDHTAYMRQSSLERAAQALESYLTPPSTAEDLYWLASARIAQEKFPEALTYVERCLALYSEEDELVLTDLWLKKGCLHAVMGQPEEAQEALDRALSFAPQSADAYLVKSQVCIEQGENGRALESMKRYFELHPQGDAYRLTLAQLMADQGDTQGALEELNLLAEKGLADAQAYSLRGAAYFQEGDYARAEADFTQCEALDGATGDIYYYRGICRMLAERYLQASQDFEKARELAMAQGKLLYLQALCDYQTEDYARALVGFTSSSARAARGKTSCFIKASAI